MKLENGCNAAWYEINISAPDNCVSACCYYSGEKDTWSDEILPLDDYWNSPNMQRIRGINSNPDQELSGGCTGCYFFGHRGESGSYFPQFLYPSEELTPEQEANWLAAIDDYKSGRKQLKSTPLRFYINFGFGCNLSCTMCHQVPRRKENKRQVKADILSKWKPYLKAALEITVIGGEPFMLPEATKFIEEVIADPELENVQLTINTNGTLLHKHMDTLAKKRKLVIAVSLDTIGEEFEKIRIGARWKQIERNILEFKALGERLGYSWRVGVPCLLLKTNIPRLYDFAEWTIVNDVQPGFYDFINATGIEQTFAQENVLAHPHLLREVPDWEQCFTSTIQRLRSSQWSAVADQLENLYIQIKKNLLELAFKESQAQVNLQHVQNKLHVTQSALTYERERIAAMESSKFWKLRQAWFQLKQSVGIKSE